MKSKGILGVVVLLMLFPVMAGALTWVAVNQKTTYWDAVTTLSNGTPIPAGDSIEYEVFMKDGGGNVFLDGRTANTQRLSTFTVEGLYIVGCQAVRVRGGVDISRSTITWSDDPKYSPVPFGIQFFYAPAEIGGYK